MKLEHTPEWEALAQNHLEGRTVAFSAMAKMLKTSAMRTAPGLSAPPGLLRSRGQPYRDLREAYAPLVWQCRFSGIEVPETLWRFEAFGKGHKYSDDQAEHMQREATFLDAFDSWTHAFAEFVNAKGKVEPGKHRAFGHEAPGHKWADLKLYTRDLAMRVGLAPAESSPQLQRDLGLNQDERLDPKQSEGNACGKLTLTK